MKKIKKSMALLFTLALLCAMQIGTAMASSSSGYTILFYRESGSTSLITSQVCTPGKSVALKRNTATKTGYHFVNWKDSRGATYADGASVNLTSKYGLRPGNSIGFYAQWALNKYTVNFSSNGGSGSMSPLSCTYNSSYTVPANRFTRAGYTFTGFICNGKLYKPGDTIRNLTTTHNGSVTMTAQWSANKYYIAFDKNNGSGSMSTVYTYYGSNYTLPACGFSRTGYTFTGWTFAGRSYANRATVSNLTTTNGATVTLKANWAVNKYTIAYNANGGSGSMASQTGCAYGTTYTLRSNTYTRPGYIFSGWTCNGTSYANGASVRNLTATNNGTVTMYAKWTPIKYTIKFASNGGSGTMNNISCTYGTPVTLPANAFTRTNYAFTGWTYNGGTYANKTTVTNLTTTNGATVTLTAKWVGTYTLQVSPNGATSGGTGSTIGRYNIGSSVTIPTNYFGRTGYDFVNWNTASNGSGTSYKSGQVVSSGLSTTPGAVITLHPQWKAKSVNVTFNANGGYIYNQNGSLVTSATFVKSYNGTYSAPAPTSRTGYVFNGWYTAPSGGVKITSASRITQTTNFTVYAQWSPITYTISFSSNGGTGSMSPMTCSYDRAYTLSPNGFTRTGYRFAGWTYGGKTYANKATVKNLSTTAQTIILIAKWENTFEIYDENDRKLETKYFADGASVSLFTGSIDVEKYLQTAYYNIYGYKNGSWVALQSNISLNTRFNTSGLTYGKYKVCIRYKDVMTSAGSNKHVLSYSGTVSPKEVQYIRVNCDRENWGYYKPFLTNSNCEVSLIYYERTEYESYLKDRSSADYMDHTRTASKLLSGKDHFWIESRDFVYFLKVTNKTTSAQSYTYSLTSDTNTYAPNGNQSVVWEATDGSSILHEVYLTKQDLSAYLTYYSWCEAMGDAGLTKTKNWKKGFAEAGKAALQAAGVRALDAVTFNVCGYVVDSASVISAYADGLSGKVENDSYRLLLNNVNTIGNVKSVPVPILDSNGRDTGFKYKLYYLDYGVHFTLCYNKDVSVLLMNTNQMDSWNGRSTITMRPGRIGKFTYGTATLDPGKDPKNVSWYAACEALKGCDIIRKSTQPEYYMLWY